MILKSIVHGVARGTILRSNSPINFLGAVDKKSGIINDERSNIFGKRIGGVILVFPHGIGSSVGAYTIYSLKSNGTAPLAMVCTKPDLTVASGCALADIPLVIADSDEYDSLKDGEEIILDTESKTLKRAFV